MKFYLLTPNVSKENRTHMQPQKVYKDYNIYYPSNKSKYTSTKEDAQFCIDFTIESSIILQEFNTTGVRRVTNSPSFRLGMK
jgi:hypothetical protein